MLGFGGYASLPTVLAARSLGLPTVVHEANAVAGRANLVAARFADAVLLAFETARSAFAPTSVVTGVPVRDDIVRLGATARAMHDGARRVLVMGGSDGSTFLDRQVPALLARVVARGCPVIARHLVGGGDVGATRAGYATAGVPADVAPYAHDIAAAYAWADFAVTSAGAVTLAELAVVGLPALVVPLADAAFDHQTANARAFAALTGVPWVSEDTFRAEPLADLVARLLTSDEAWSAASAGIRRAARADAADAVVRACRTLSRGAGAGSRASSR